MAGYRQSSFDPNAGGQAPLRPYNKWQRLGVAMVVAGALLVCALVIRKIATGDHATDDWIPFSTSILLFGSILVNSRRDNISSEQAARQRKRALIIIGVALAICAVAAVAAFTFKGA